VLTVQFNWNAFYRFNYEGKSTRKMSDFRFFLWWFLDITPCSPLEVTWVNVVISQKTELFKIAYCDVLG
jgi:hypothetical protein